MQPEFIKLTCDDHRSIRLRKDLIDYYGERTGSATGSAVRHDGVYEQVRDTVEELDKVLCPELNCMPGSVVPMPREIPVPEEVRNCQTPPQEDKIVKLNALIDSQNETMGQLRRLIDNLRERLASRDQQVRAAIDIKNRYRTDVEDLRKQLEGVNKEGAR